MEEGKVIHHFITLYYVNREEELCLCCGSEADYSCDLCGLFCRVCSRTLGNFVGNLEIMAVIA